MAIPLVQVRHKETGAKTFLPETALRHLPDYVKTPTQKSRDEVADGTAFPAEPTIDEDDEDDEPTAEPPRTGAGATTDAWRAYAVDVLHLEVDDDLGRDGIVALVDAANS